MQQSRQYQDPTTNLYYLRARWYDPATGQFLARDPLAGLSNEPYAYAGDSPFALYDPDGQSALPGPIHDSSLPVGLSADPVFLARQLGVSAQQVSTAMQMLGMAGPIAIDYSDGGWAYPISSSGVARCDPVPPNIWIPLAQLIFEERGRGDTRAVTEWALGPQPSEHPESRGTAETIVAAGLGCLGGLEEGADLVGLAATEAAAAIPGLDLGEGVVAAVACVAGAAGGMIGVNTFDPSAGG